MRVRTLSRTADHPAAPATLSDILAEHARSRRAEPAVVDATHRSTYAELAQRVGRLASVLEGEGVGADSVVLWTGRNSHRLLEALLASSELGAVFCPANWRSAPDELEFIVRDCVPRVVLFEGGGLQPVATDLDSGWIRHDSEADGSYERLLAAASVRPPAAQPDPLGPVVMLYTAAFEGRPNGAQLTHLGLITHNSAMQLGHGLGPETICLNAAPLFHIGGLYYLLTTFQAGGCNVFIPQADPVQFCEAVQEERCTSAYLVEATTTRIEELNRDRRYDLSSLRTRSFGPGWDAMVSPDGSPRGKRPGAYGQSELSGLVTLASLGGEGLHGRPISGTQVRLVTEDGGDVAEDQVGEIVVRGPTVMLGYRNRPELNARRFRDGWYRTNDLGLRMPDGSLTFVGPKARMIKSGKENIYPQEVERCILQHPAVAQAAVIGSPDPVYDQSVKAIVVLRPDASVTEDELIEHCRRHLASYKKPRSVVFAESLPRGATGVDYAALDLAYGGGGYPGVQLAPASGGGKR